MTEKTFDSEDVRKALESLYAAQRLDAPDQAVTEAPIFNIALGPVCETPAGWLPSVCVTVPAYESAEVPGTLERSFIDYWPETTYEDDDPDDARQGRPLEYGSWFYNEAMKYQAPELHRLRIEAFQAAEVLYRWSAAAGNVQAVVNLGYIYSYDRCEGLYWDRVLRALEGDAAAGAWECPRDEWAYACFAYGAEHGNDEACYKLGDFQKQGRGCLPDEAAAFKSYQRAYELAKTWNNGSWGPSALRLGTCYEEGVGSDPDFEQARHWYGIARAGLSIMVNEGAWHYRRSLKQAEDGAKRMDQELAG